VASAETASNRNQRINERSLQTEKKNETDSGALLTQKNKE
jgi:hypothetical protein